MLALTSWAPGVSSAQAQQAPPDPRQTASAASPGWLAAIGSLAVPAQRRTAGRASHYLEDCSATLVSRSGSGTAQIIVTAWHCLENYHDLSRPIVFSLAGRENAALRVTARKLADGGGMHADWAILRLERGISETIAASLSIHPERADITRPVTMAGYSTTANEPVRSLRYHENCRITAQQRVSADTDCVAFKGSSGGAVTQRSASGAVQFSGVISEGDSVGYSRFVPVSVFRNSLNRYLR